MLVPSFVVASRGKPSHTTVRRAGEVATNVDALGDTRKRSFRDCCFAIRVLSCLRRKRSRAISSVFLVPSHRAPAWWTDDCGGIGLRSGTASVATAAPVSAERTPVPEGSIRRSNYASEASRAPAKPSSVGGLGGLPPGSQHSSQRGLEGACFECVSASGPSLARAAYRLTRASAWASFGKCGSKSRSIRRSTTGFSSTADEPRGDRPD